MTWQAQVRGGKAAFGDIICAACSGPISVGDRIGTLVEYDAANPKGANWYPFSGRLHHECAVALVRVVTAEYQENMRQRYPG